MSRRAPGWIPNQHGAWAMLATPLLVGILASRPTWAHLPLTAFWFLGYFAFFAAGLWLKAAPARRARYLPHGLLGQGLLQVELRDLDHVIDRECLEHGHQPVHLRHQLEVGGCIRLDRQRPVRRNQE